MTQTNDKSAEKPHIKVWNFADAPEEYRALSGHGGDEDWVAHIPVHLVDRYIPWLEDEMFGNSVEEHTLDDGSKIKIVAHA